MAQFTVDIPDELLPVLVAEFSLVQGSTAAASPEEYFAASVVETVRQRAEIYKVGPYYTGPILPKFNPDGTPYSPDWAPPVVEAGAMEPEAIIEPEEVEVVEPPAAIEPEIVVEPEMEADAEAGIEPALADNDTSQEEEV
jgi:hypothetical protein